MTTLSPEHFGELKVRAVAIGIDDAALPAPNSKVIDLQAMSLDMPVTPDHPNKHPFSGVMTRIDEPSDAAPHGSGGRLVMITRAAAEAALPTLLGMGIDCAENLSAHAPSHKIGVITTANIAGNAIEIEGYFFAKDFPREMKAIQAQKQRLGFSFELTPTDDEITAGNVFQVNAGFFTGAALLYRDKAAYHTTSLAAATEKGTVMTIEELQAQVAATNGRLEKVETENKELKAQLEANANTMSKVEPHAKALESCADNMEAAGIGADPKNGHMVTLRKMAGSMRASAAMGKMPAIYRDHDYTDFNAAAAGDPELKKTVEKLTSDLKAATDKSADLETQVKDLKAGRRQSVEPPERKTISASVNELLQRRGIKPLEAGAELDMGAVDTALAGTNMTTVERIKFKRQIERAAEEPAA